LPNCFLAEPERQDAPLVVNRTSFLSRCALGAIPQTPQTKSTNPFQNESNTLQTGDLRIENRVSFYGSLDVTRDKEGLANARQLMRSWNGGL